jgi:hypothetical protein
MARVAGTATFIINGRAYSTSVEEGHSIKIQGVKRAAVPSADGAIHYSEEVVQDTISCRLITTPVLNPEVIAQMADATVQVNLNNGTTAILDDAFFSGDAAVATKDGMMECEFSGRGRWLA